jgi:hypothetical protein
MVGILFSIALVVLTIGMFVLLIFLSREPADVENESEDHLNEAA